MIIGINYLYFIILLILLCSFAIVNFKNIVYSLILLIFCFVLTFILFVLVGSEFLAFFILIVYVGAIVILFIFVLMLLNIKILETNKNVKLSKGIFSLIFLFVYLLIIMYIFVKQNLFFKDNFWYNNLYNDFLNNDWSLLNNYSNTLNNDYTFLTYNEDLINETKKFGFIFYNYFWSYLLIISFILLLAMIGSVYIITLNEKKKFQ